MTDIAIRVENLGKQARYKTLRDATTDTLTNPLRRLPEPDASEIMRCPESGWRYQQIEPGVLHCLDWPEDGSLS